MVRSGGTFSFDIELSRQKVYATFMQKSRIEAFSDGVLAIIITIMVLEIKIPEDSSLSSLLKLMPIFISYIISFLYIGIYWNNHHHLFQSVARVNGQVLWANLHLLFWLSLVPFASGWMGENHFEGFTVSFYGAILFFAAFAYYLLTVSLVKGHGNDSLLTKAVGSTKKEYVSLGLYLIGLLISFWFPLISLGIFFLVGLLWLYPDSRIEKAFRNS